MKSFSKLESREVCSEHGAHVNLRKLGLSAKGVRLTPTPLPPVK